MEVGILKQADFINVEESRLLGGGDKVDLPFIWTYLDRPPFIVLISR